jgi:hypothetical protein
VADLMTAIPIVLLVGAAVARWPRHPEPVRAAGRHPYRSWVLWAAAVLVWELTAYAARGSRGAHPTLSSMADALDRHYLLKALVFFAWLCLCVVVVQAGTVQRDR